MSRILKVYCAVVSLLSIVNLIFVALAVIESWREKYGST